MKKIACLIVLAVVLASCQTQKKQWWGTSAEIDVIKKMDEAFVAGDLAAYRAAFADTTKVWFNQWTGTPISPDTLVSNIAATRATLTSLKMNDPYYEMIENDDGQRMVHRWIMWEATLTSGKSYTWASNADFIVSDGKIRTAYYIFNALPGYQANQPDPAPAPAK